MYLRCLTLFLPSEKGKFFKPTHSEHVVWFWYGNYTRNSYIISSFLLSFPNKNQIKIIALYSKVCHRSAWVTLLLLTDWSSSNALTRLWSTSQLWLRAIPAAVQISKTGSILCCCHCCSVGRLRTDASSVQQLQEAEKKRRTQHCFPWGESSMASCLSDTVNIHVYQTG